MVKEKIMTAVNVGAPPPSSTISSTESQRESTTGVVRASSGAVEDLPPSKKK